mgnify:CR=1 FL=1
MSDFDKILSNIINFLNIDPGSFSSDSPPLPYKNEQRVSDTPEEALIQSRADSLKKGQDLTGTEDNPDNPTDEEFEEAVDKWLSDFFEDLL